MSHEWSREAMPGASSALLEPGGRVESRPSEAAQRRRGRPPIMSRDEVVETIRRLAARPEGLFRVHDTHGHVYARARRTFGSWAAAVDAAGHDYAQIVAEARKRSADGRRRVSSRSK